MDAAAPTALAPPGVRISVEAAAERAVRRLEVTAMAFAVVALAPWISRVAFDLPPFTGWTWWTWAVGCVGLGGFALVFAARVRLRAGVACALRLAGFEPRAGLRRDFGLDATRTLLRGTPQEALAYLCARRADVPAADAQAEATRLLEAPGAAERVRALQAHGRRLLARHVLRFLVLSAILFAPLLVFLAGAWIGAGASGLEWQRWSRVGLGLWLGVLVAYQVPRTARASLVHYGAWGRLLRTLGTNAPESTPRREPATPTS